MFTVGQKFIFLTKLGMNYDYYIFSHYEKIIDKHFTASFLNTLLA